MKLEQELENKVKLLSDGGNGFGAPEAVEQHDREIQYLKFKITQKNNITIAIISATIGAVTAGIFTTIFKLLSP